MAVGEEEKSSQSRRLNCVYFKKSNLNENPKYKLPLNKENSKESVKPSEKESQVRPSESKENKGNLEVFSIDSSKKLKRCSFFKKSNLDYMERYKNKRLDFFCKHTLRYVPKHKKAQKPEHPAPPSRENVSGECDGFNPLKRFNFPY